MPLSTSQKQFLRGLAHQLNPVIMVGQKGITPTLLKEFSGALDHHELVKVRLSGGDREQRSSQIEEMCAASGAELVQTIGHTASFWRRNAEEAKLPLPK
ncbi:MAG: ribosome assembly RNA-binding protein YhbY [Dokdonella sp.]